MELPVPAHWGGGGGGGGRSGGSRGERLRIERGEEMCRGFGAAAANGAGGEHGREVCRRPAAWAGEAGARSGSGRGGDRRQGSAGGGGVQVAGSGMLGPRLRRREVRGGAGRKQGAGAAPARVGGRSLGRAGGRGDPAAVGFESRRWRTVTSCGSSYWW